MIINEDDYLEHFGVKGMKWGVRKYQNDDGSLTSLGKKREQMRYDQRIAKWYSTRSNVAKAEYSRREFEDAKTRLKLESQNKKQYDKYNKEAGKLWSDSYKEMAIKNIGKDPVTKGYEYIDELPYMHMYD